MTDDDKDFLLDIIEQEIMKYTDWNGVFIDGMLATRIANAIEAKFALITYKD